MIFVHSIHSNNNISGISLQLLFPGEAVYIKIWVVFTKLLN